MYFCSLYFQSKSKTFQSGTIVSLFLEWLLQSLHLPSSACASVCNGMQSASLVTNHMKELGFRSMTKYKELINTANILTLPGLLRCEVPELDDWERIKEDAKK